jgi:hypothetical protein
MMRVLKQKAKDYWAYGNSTDKALLKLLSPSTFRFLNKAKTK